MNKEQIYDAEISPLMAKIIEICQRENIALIAAFAIPIPGDPGLRCTTALMEPQAMEGVAQPDDFYSAKSMLLDGFVAFTRRVS